MENDANLRYKGLYSLSMVILPELCPTHQKQYIGSVVGLVITVSGVLGPVLGGILTQYASWRWVFWVKYESPLPPSQPQTHANID